MAWAVENQAKQLLCKRFFLGTSVWITGVFAADGDGENGDKIRRRKLSTGSSTSCAQTDSAVGPGVEIFLRS